MSLKPLRRDPALIPLSHDHHEGLIAAVRLKSGRLLLFWNRLLPEGRADYPRRSGRGYSQRPASWHRDELSLAFSSDDGRTWSEPKIILRGDALVSYPSAFERREGEIWVSLNHKSHRSFRFLEADLIGAPHDAQ